MITALKWVFGGIASIIGLFITIIVVKLVFFGAFYWILIQASENMQ